MSYHLHKALLDHVEGEADHRAEMADLHRAHADSLSESNPHREHLVAKAEQHAARAREHRKAAGGLRATLPAATETPGGKKSAYWERTTDELREGATVADMLKAEPAFRQFVGELRENPQLREILGIDE